MNNSKAQNLSSEVEQQSHIQILAYYINMMYKCGERGNLRINDFINMETGKDTYEQSGFSFFPLYTSLFNEILEDANLGFKAKSFYLRCLDSFFKKYSIEPEEFLWSELSGQTLKPTDHTKAMLDLWTMESETSNGLQKP